VVGEMGLESGEWEELKREALVEEGRRLASRSKEEVYAQYVLAQSACVRDLLVVGSKDLKPNASKAAWVSAIKARSEIFDRVIRMGQELGLIEKREVEGGKGTSVNVGVVLSGLSDGELRGEVVRELGNLNKIVEEFGEGELLELKPGRLYSRGEKKRGRKNPTDSNRIYKGAGVDRRVRDGT